MTDIPPLSMQFHNATQQRNDTHQDILKEEVISHPLVYKEWCNWASAACVETETGGFALMTGKISQGAINQEGKLQLQIETAPGFTFLRYACHHG